MTGLTGLTVLGLKRSKRSKRSEQKIICQFCQFCQFCHVKIRDDNYDMTKIYIPADKYINLLLCHHFLYFICALCGDLIHFHQFVKQATFIF